MLNNIVFWGVSAAGLAVLIRKVLASLQSVLRLAEELDPPKPSAASDFKSPGLMNSIACSDVESITESLVGLSGAIARSDDTCGDLSVNPRPVKVPAAQETPD
jgi:hypothetical protein